MEIACREDSDLEGSGWSAASEAVGDLRFRMLRQKRMRWATMTSHVTGRCAGKQCHSDLSAAGSVLFATVRLSFRSVLWLTWIWFLMSTRPWRSCS